MNNYHPFLDPLWRRIVLVVLVAGWAAYEVILAREPLWMMIAIAMLAYGCWAFILNWPKMPGPSDPRK
jgi:hypothetical protein